MEIKELKTLIRDRGLTYEDLAEEIRVTPQAISEIVNGRTTSSTARYALASALGLEVNDIWPEHTKAA